jgi:hypothetical protein
MGNKILKGILFEEINRTREIMGLPTLTEQKALGKLYDDAVGSLLGNLGRKGVKELSQEQQDALKKLIANSAEIERAGIKSIADVVDDAGKQLLLKTIRDNSDAIKTTFDDIVSDYTKNTMTIINKRLNSIPNLKTEISKLKAGNFTALSLLQKIEREGTKGISSYQLLGLKNTLTDAKTTFSSNREMTDYLDGVIKQVDGVINSKQDISKIGKGSVDNVVGKAVDNVGGKSEMINFIDGIEDIQLKSDLTDVVSKISDDEMKQIDDIVSKIPKEKEGEFIDLMMNKVCSINESRNIGKLSKLLTESNFDKGCNNFSKLVKLFDKKQRVPAAILKMMLSIFVLVVGSVALIDLGAGFFNVRKSGYKISNPFDSGEETPEGESGSLGPDDY